MSPHKSITKDLGETYMQRILVVLVTKVMEYILFLL
jgi:hypothetical protein